jgi:hypothetical protein
VLEQVPWVIVSVVDFGHGRRMRIRGNVQLPGAVTQLRASLADVEVANLESTRMLVLLAHQLFHC